MSSSLTIIKFSRRQINAFVSYITQKIGSTFHSVSSGEILNQKSNLVSGKKRRKYFKMSSAENITQHVNFNLGHHDNMPI